MVFKNKINHFCTSSKLTMISAETGSRLTLEEIKTEKDLGVYFSSDLKWRTHCQHSAAKANSILGQLRQNIQRRATKLVSRLPGAYELPGTINRQRVASSWNNLASSTVNAPTLNSFKARLDKHLALANNTTT